MGPNAQSVPFNFGVNNITPGTSAVGSNCYACSGNPNSDVANYSPTAVPYHNYNLFSYTSYKLTDDITASLMLNYGWNAEKNIANNGRQTNYTIHVDNAFIPANHPAADDRPGHSQHHAGQRRDRELAEHQRRLVDQYPQRPRRRISSRTIASCIAASSP